MAITQLPRQTTLLPEKLSDPRVGPVTAPGKVGPVGPQPAKAACDCTTATPRVDPEWERSKRLDAYLKGRFEPITPLGLPPGDRRILAEAGIELARFEKYPVGITPAPRDPRIKRTTVPFRSPRDPEVARALSNRLTLLQSMPKGITSLSRAFRRSAPGKGANTGSVPVPSAAWATYADAMASGVVIHALVLPGGSQLSVESPSSQHCACTSQTAKAGSKAGGP